MHTKKLYKLRFDIYTGLKTSICSFMIRSLNIKKAMIMGYEPLEL